MRLSSLARKIKTTPKHLSALLIAQDISLPQGANTKLEASSIEFVLTHFKVSLEEIEKVENIVDEPDVVIEKLASQTEVAEDILDEPVSTESTTPVSEEIKPEEETSLPVIEKEDFDPITETEKDAIVSVEEESSIDQEAIENKDTITEEATDTAIAETDVTIDTPEETKAYIPIETEDGLLIESLAELAALDENVKLIKAQKAQPLQGLTIKGKIDLPEPKSPQEKTSKKEEAPLDPNTILYTSGPQRERKKRKPKNTHRQPRSKVNPVELERRKKEKEQKRKQAYKERKEKEAKAAHYNSKITPPKSQKPTKKKAKKKQNVQEPKFEGNALQKLWKWLNT